MREREREAILIREEPYRERERKRKSGCLIEWTKHPLFLLSLSLSPDLKKVLSTFFHHLGPLSKMVNFLLHKFKSNVFFFSFIFFLCLLSVCCSSSHCSSVFFIPLFWLDDALFVDPLSDLKRCSIPIWSGFRFGFCFFSDKSRFPCFSVRKSQSFELC